MSHDDEGGFAQTETPGDYDPEGVQFAVIPDGYVMVHLPEITYLDTQQWAVDIGLTPERLVQLRDAIDSHLRGAAGHAGPANRSDIATVAAPGGGVANGSRGDTPTTAGDAQAVVAPFGGAANDRVTAGHSVVGQQPVTYPITSHAYQGERFLHPCTAIGYGSMCGATEYDHEEQR